MTEKEAIERHLSNNKEEENRICFSGFMAALRDAIEATDRDPEIGTIGYMALLNHELRNH